MIRLLWPLAVLAAFGLGFAAATMGRDSGASSQEGGASQATVERLRAQVRALEARLRSTGAASADRPDPTTGLAATAMAPQADGAASGDDAPRRGRSGRRGAVPHGEPQDDLAPASPVARPAQVRPATVDAALERLFKFFDGATGTGPANWRQRRELVDDLRAMGDAGTEALVRMLSGGTTTDERRTAAELLGQLGDPRAMSMLQDVLDKDNDVLLRRAAAASMRKLAAPESAPYLEALMKNGGEDRYVRMSAAYGLAQLGKPQGVNGLTMIFDEAQGDGRGREQAFRALRSLNDERSLPFMRDVATSSAEPTYRLQAIRFLTAQADRQSLAALQRIMTSPSEQPSVRDAAAQAYHAIQSK